MYEETKDKPEHTVEYRSIDYYSMCEKSKAKIKAMPSLRLKKLSKAIWVAIQL